MVTFTARPPDPVLAAGMLWLAEGRLNTTGLASVHAAETATQVYADLIARKAPAPTAIFRWH